MFDDLDLTRIIDEHTREQVVRLLNLIETLDRQRYNACVMRSTG